MNGYSDRGWLSLKSPVGFDWTGRHAADFAARVVLLKSRMLGMSDDRSIA